MSIPDLYLVDDGNAYWLEPSYDHFGDPDVELAGCPMKTTNIPDFESWASVDWSLVDEPFDPKRLRRIEAALRAIADNGPDA